MEGGLLSLRWNDHGNTFFDMLSSIRRKEAFCDVTLVCEGRYYPVHKLVLSTCSDFFDNLFCKTDCKHPIVILANVFPKDLEALLNYMYLGEVNVLQTELPDLMKAADVLRIKGLAEPLKNLNKDSKERKHSSGGEAVDGVAKRRRSEDSITSSRRLLSPHLLEKSHANERGVRPRPSTSPHVSKRSGSQRNLPGSSSNTLINIDQQEMSSTCGTSSPNASLSNPQESLSRDVDDDLSSKALRPEVKVEEVLVKDEEDGWFDGSDEGLDALPFNESESSLDFNSEATGGGGGAGAVTSYSGGCIMPWGDLGSSSSSHSHHLEGHLPLEMPPSSGMQGDLTDFARQRQYFSPDIHKRPSSDCTKYFRKFVDAWKRDFQWLYFDLERNMMFCTTCLRYRKENERKTSFVTGNNTFKREALEQHEQSAIHVVCEAQRISSDCRILSS